MRLGIKPGTDAEGGGSTHHYIYWLCLLGAAQLCLLGAAQPLVLVASIDKIKFRERAGMTLPCR